MTLNNIITTPTYTLKLPVSGKDIKYRPFLVKDEKILLLAQNESDTKNRIESVKQVLRNCILTEVDLDNLPITDIEFIFLHTRMKSKGEVINLINTCKDCKEKKAIAFNLNEVKVQNNKKIDNKIMISDTVGIVLQYPTFTTAEKFATLDEGDNIKFIANCIECVFSGDKVYDSKTTTPEEYVEFLDKLEISQFKQLIEFFENLPRLLGVIEYDCKCGKHIKIELEGLSNFL